MLVFHQLEEYMSYSIHVYMMAIVVVNIVKTGRRPKVRCSLHNKNT